MIRNLMDQVQVAVVARTSDAPCQVTGYARPRSYDLLSQDQQPVDSGPPSIVLGLKHPVIAWSDPHDGQRRAYAVPVDEALRNRTLPVDLSPEGKHVLTPTLLPVAERFLATYWDATGASPGVYLRWLDGNAIIAAAPLAVTEPRPGAYQAVAARHGDGFVVAWVDQVDKDSSDVFYRRYDSSAKPLGEAVRATDYIAQGREPTRAHEIQVSASDDTIYLAYGVVRSSMQQVRFMAVPASTKPPGLEATDGKNPKERTLVDEVMLTLRGDRADSPSLACTEKGCFVSWHQVHSGGASVAFLDPKTGAAQWHKRFSSSGKKPAIGMSPAGELRLAWFEGGRLTTAALGREGVGPESKVARVVGDQPPAARRVVHRLVGLRVGASRTLCAAHAVSVSDVDHPS
jgi:serine/threonine-protein kinase